MAVSLDDVRHIAALARLGLTDARAQSLATELNAILGHVDALSRVDTSSVSEADGHIDGMPLRPDALPPDALARDPQAFAPAMRHGFFIVPRLATHETESDA